MASSAADLIAPVGQRHSYIKVHVSAPCLMFSLLWQVRVSHATPYVIKGLIIIVYIIAVLMGYNPTFSRNVPAHHQ